MILKRYIKSSIIPAQCKKYSNKLKQQVYYQPSTAKDIQTFLDKWVVIQQTKIIKQTKSGEGKIVSFKAFDLLQIDGYVLLKYAKQNKDYGYKFL